MKISIGKYRNNIPFIKSYIEKNKNRTLDTLLSELAVATYVPLIAVAYFIGEMTEFSSELNSKIENIKRFYGYTEVVE